MSAIARYYNFAGYRVSGYDKTPSPLTQSLQDEGISIRYSDSPDLIPTDVEGTLVIYTPAIPHDLNELQYVKNGGYRLIKRSRALGEIASGQSCLAVAGTHGKTTTSTILAHIFKNSGEGCNAFLGGISKNYNTNLLLSKNRVLVAEADEFDRSFLQLFPDTSIITSVDADHLDIYGKIEELHDSFKLFAAQTKRHLIIKDSIDLDFGNVTQAHIYRYSYDRKCDFYASDIELKEGGYFNFTLNFPDGAIADCTLGIPGWINIENAIAASASAYLNGISPDKIREALANFSGVRRRFDIHVNSPVCAYIDDYAHHPEEIRAAIGSIRNIFPHRKLCGVFQPHLYSRTKDFYIEFAQALSLLDELILLDIYPAREDPIEGVSSQMIFDLVTIKAKTLIEKNELIDELQRHEIDSLATFGAGDIDRLVPKISEYIKRRYNV